MHILAYFIIVGVRIAVKNMALGSHRVRIRVGG